VVYEYIGEGEVLLLYGGLDTHGGTGIGLDEDKVSYQQGPCNYCHSGCSLRKQPVRVSPESVIV
jgi:hypothetical protein